MQVIRKPSILRRLTERLGIEPGILATDRVLSQIVQPITNVDELLQAVGITLATGNLETGNIEIPVPRVKRWTLLGISRATTTGLTTVRLVAPSGDTYDLDPTTASAQNWLFGKGFIIDQLWIIRLLQTSNAADASGKTLSAWFIEEDAY